jgi:hypothetical protein
MLKLKEKIVDKLLSDEEVKNILGFCKLIVYDTTPLVDFVISRPPLSFTVSGSYNKIVDECIRYIANKTPNSVVINPSIPKELNRIMVLKQEDVIKTEGTVFILKNEFLSKSAFKKKYELYLEWFIMQRRHLRCQIILFAPMSYEDKNGLGLVDKRIRYDVNEVRKLPLDELDKKLGIENEKEK